MGSKPTNYDLQQDQRPLDQFEKPVASLNLNNQKIENLGLPLIGTDASSKAYVDSVAQGLSWRPPVRTLDIVNTFRPTGLGVVIDGVTMQADDRTLFINLAIILENNRVYRAFGTGTNITGWGLETDGKAGDGSPSEGDTLLVKEGNNYADQGWTYSNGGWIQFTGTGLIDAGQGLAKNLNTLYIGNGDGITIGADNISLNITALAGLVLTGTSPTKSVGLNVDNNSLEVTAGNVLQVKADGISQVHWKPLGAVDNNNQIINNVLDPVLNQDVATKAYVDAQIGTENLWDRASATIKPHFVNDDIFPNGMTALGDTSNRFSSLWLSGKATIAGDIEFDTSAVGVILKSRTGDDRYRIFLDDNGVLHTELII